MTVRTTVSRRLPSILVGLAAVLTTVPGVAPADEPTPRPSATEAPPLVSRGRVTLHLAGAERVVAAAKASAAEHDLRVNVAVVDDGGHLLAFARMDGARPASAVTAMTKAVAAATMREPTGPRTLPDGTVNVHLNLALEHAAAAGGARVTTLQGGVPIVVDGQVVGAVGVGGATGEQDKAIATAGVSALLDDLGAGPTP